MIVAIGQPRSCFPMRRPDDEVKRELGKALTDKNVKEAVGNIDKDGRPLSDLSHPETPLLRTSKSVWTKHMPIIEPALISSPPYKNGQVVQIYPPAIIQA